MAQAEAITFEEFRTRYEREEACREELFRLRFPEGFVCPKCGCREYYPVCARNTYQCRNCRHQTSVTAGTVMHRTRLPLIKWSWAMYLCATDKRRILASPLKDRLNVCKVFDPSNGDLKWFYKAIGNLKAFLLGTYHGHCTKLQPYLDEFCFRLNRRHVVGQLFLRLTHAVAISCVLLS